MKRNKIIRVVIIAVCLLLVLSQVALIFAAPASSQSVGSVIVSIYDDSASAFMVENTAVDIDSANIVADLLVKLKDKKHIKACTLQNGVIMSVTGSDDVQLKSDGDTLVFYVKLNGDLINQTGASQVLKSGDIVEIIYGEYSIKTNASAPAQSTLSSLPPDDNHAKIEWNTNLAKLQTTGFDWLNRNIGSQSTYLITAGAIEKTADIKTSSQYINTILQTKEYDNAGDLAENVLALTFSGLDASAEKQGRLVQNLYTFPDIMKNGILGAVTTLLAYDCNAYSVPDDAINSRQVLVKAILSYQNSDGGFPLNLGKRSDVNSTAMALMALSTYAGNTGVLAAVESALTYLSESQDENGGFMLNTVESLDNLSAVVIALNSNKVLLNDERFDKGKLTLIENLLQYQNSDGGFASTIGDKSSADATEQALVALASVKRASNPYILAKPIEKDTSVSDEENVSPIRSDASLFLVIIGSVLALVAIGTLTYLIRTKEHRKSK